jgi:hypothetical protein
VKAQAERDQIPVYQFQHKERKDDIANDFRRKRGVRDQIVFMDRENDSECGNPQEVLPREPRPLNDGLAVYESTLTSSGSNRFQEPEVPTVRLSCAVLLARIDSIFSHSAVTVYGFWITPANALLNCPRTIVSL